MNYNCQRCNATLRLYVGERRRKWCSDCLPAIKAEQQRGYRAAKRPVRSDDPLATDNEDRDYGDTEYRLAEIALKRLRAELAAERAWTDRRTATLAQAEPQYAA